MGGHPADKGRSRCTCAATRRHVYVLTWGRKRKKKVYIIKNDRPVNSTSLVVFCD